MRHYTISFLTTLAMSLIPHNSSATPELPTHFPLKTLAITIQYQTAQSIPDSYQLIIDGDGKIIISRNDKTTQPKPISKDTLLELINDFYQIHFFELSDTYTVKTQVVLQNDGNVAILAQHMTDMDTKHLCIQLADYKKCITVVNGQPASLSSLIQRIENKIVYLDTPTP